MTDEERKQWEELVRKLLLSGESPERLREEIARAEYETYCTGRGERHWRDSTMSGDYKYEAQLIADEQAQEQFGKDFYDLTQEQQMKLYGEAMQAYVERRIP